MICVIITGSLPSHDSFTVRGDYSMHSLLSGWEERGGEGGGSFNILWETQIS